MDTLEEVIGKKKMEAVQRSIKELRNLISLTPIMGQVVRDELEDYVKKLIQQLGIPAKPISFMAENCPVYVYNPDNCFATIANIIRNKGVFTAEQLQDTKMCLEEMRKDFEDPLRYLGKEKK